MKLDWIEDNVLAASGIPLGLKDLRELHQAGIRAILTLTERPLTLQKEITPEALAVLDLHCFHLPVDDQFPPSPEQVKQAVAFIDRMRAEGKPALVHCAAGIGRTGTMLHAYFLAKGLGLEAAKERVKSRKPTSQWTMLSAVQQRFLEQFATDYHK